MTISPRLGIQAVEHDDGFTPSDTMQTSFNVMLGELDGIASEHADGFDTNAPPTLVFGDVYKIGASPSGAWVGHADEIAIAVYTAFDAGGLPTTLAWRFITPADGIKLYDIVNDELLLLTSASGDTWEIIPRSGTTVAALTDSTGGTPGATLSAVGNTMTIDQSTTINDNFASINAKFDELVASLEGAGYIA